MKIGILTRNKNAWGSSELRDALNKRRIHPICFSFQNLVARIDIEPKISFLTDDPIIDLSALIVRPIGRGSLEEIIFRMNSLHRLEQLGLYVINPPSAIEFSVDKYYTLALLEDAGLPVPRTIVTSSLEEAMDAFYKLNRDIVLKPLFGSRGIGCTRISDSDVAERIFGSIAFTHSVLYIQEFMPHGFHDIRALCLGDHILTSMKRISSSWKSNISLGAKPAPHKLSYEMEDLALQASKKIGCHFSGIDIIETTKGPQIIEINSQPGWRGIQSVTKFRIAEKVINFILGKTKK